MDGTSKGFAPGRGLLAAAETLNFNMKDQRPMRQMGGGLSGGIDDQDSGSRAPRGGSGHLGSTMKLFASLGLSPSDLDALAQIPEEDISVETLPQILMQLKNHKAGRGPVSTAASDRSYRGGSWDDGGPMGGSSSFGQSDFGLGSMRDSQMGRGMGLNFAADVGNREMAVAELSQRDSYGGPLSTFSTRRKGSPSQGKVQDFLGAPPPRFPHVCSLCDFDVHSIMEWTQHTNGLRHAENRRVLLNMYPEWDPSGVPSRSGIMESTNMSAGLLGPAPQGLGPSSRRPSAWGEMDSRQLPYKRPSGSGMGLGMSGQNRSGPSMLRSRVVVVKYDRKPLSNKTLFAFTEPFGRLQEHLVLKHKAFLEMQTHEEALDMVNYYQQNPAMLYGKFITFYLSEGLMVIQKDERTTDRNSWDGKNQARKSKVVFFSNLPREVNNKKELLSIAERFGTVEKHLFLTDQAFIQMGTCEDAEMMVKYYMANPLTIRGRSIRLNISLKYKTLYIDLKQKEAGGGSARKTGEKRRRSRSGSRDESALKSGSENGEEVAGVVEEEQEEREEEEAEEEEEPMAEAEADGEEHPSHAPTEIEETEGQEEDEDVVLKKAPDDDEAKDQTAPDELEAADGAEEDQDFLENMEDFVTLDELADEEKEAEEQGRSDKIDPSRKGGLRVVNILGFRRGYKYMDELLGLATPFGKLVKHLILDWRPEAFFQFSTEEEARAMAKFYNGNVVASVCGRPVRVTHSLTYPIIQSGSSKVVYVGQLPNKYEDQDILKLAEPFGKVKKYFLNRLKRECFLEMEKADAAEEMAQSYKANQARLNNRRLLIYVSRKYTQLKYGHRCPNTTKKGSTSSSPSKSSKPAEEPPAKKIKEEKQKEAEEAEPREEEEENRQEEEQEIEPKGVKQEEEAEEDEMLQEEEEEEENKPQEKEELTESPEEEDEPPGEGQKTFAETPGESLADRETEQNAAGLNRTDEEEELEDMELEEEDKDKEEEEQPEKEEPELPAETLPPANLSSLESKSSTASLPLPPFQPDAPIGVEHIKMGFYCRVCLLFYSNEDMAKKTHCSSQSHYDKLQKHLEKEESNVEKKRAKKTSL
ncbi:matrin 3-like 1.2 isoform X2 [Stigmatopora argus]